MSFPCRNATLYPDALSVENIHSFLAAEGGPGKSPPLRLLDHVRASIRLRHYSQRTERAYIGWIRRFILFHGRRHPSQMGEKEISQFLTHLATRGGVSASTQNQALSALLFLYRAVLGRDLEWVGGGAEPP
jgi:hypothetical protein